MAAAEFNWEDPLDLESQLTDEERMIRDAARAFAHPSTVRVSAERKPLRWVPPSIVWMLLA